MIQSLDLAGLPAGAGEIVLPLAAAKAHLQVLHADDNDLIAALRDAAVVAVEDHTGLRLTPRTALVLRGEAFPAAGAPLRMFARPVQLATSLVYRDAANVERTMAGAVRVVDGDGLLPVPGSSWPSDCAGALAVTFNAGLANAAQIPAPLVTAAKLLLGTLFMQRESVVLSGATIAELPHGFTMLCAPYRRVRV